MLLFIGGAARTGKGILVRRLLVERHISYFSLDVLKMALRVGRLNTRLIPMLAGFLSGRDCGRSCER